MTVAGRLADVEQFENVIVKTGNAGEITRVRDIGRVELGAQTYGQIFKVNDRPAAGIAVFQAPGANALNVETDGAQAHGRACARISRRDWSSEIPFNTTMFVDEAIKEVYKTLIEAAVLVLIVILLFLQDWRAMLIPATTVPVTIIGAFAAMAALGFTVNLSTLFAIVLAIGIVVDDAIVIVEGVAHNIERGADAARRLDQGDGRAVRTDHRHHAGADVGVHSGGVHAGPDRPDVRAVRAGDRRDRDPQRDQRRDAEADAGRALDARAGAAGAAQHRLSRLQPRLRRARARLRPADRPHGLAQRRLGRSSRC